MVNKTGSHRYLLVTKNCTEFSKTLAFAWPRGIRCSDKFLIVINELINFLYNKYLMFFGPATIKTIAFKCKRFFLDL